MLFINGDYARITGLRMQGPTRDIHPDAVYANAISTQDEFISIIDHNEMFDWTESCVSIFSEFVHDTSDPYSRPQNVRVVRNFLHHNQRYNGGYGVATFDGYPYVEGNTFLSNRHAITAARTELTAYKAWFNLILSASPNYESIDHGPTPDFEMHGTLNIGCQYCGGDAGEYAEIARNTFLGTNRLNFMLRGRPRYAVEFHDNVSLQSQEDALRNMSDASELIVEGNHFNSPNPTHRLGVGDFDGDGTQDLFLATGTAWYFSPAGKAEWRFLNAQTDGISNLLFGDFDGDGRTDVFTQHGYNWDVSWGGVSKWETINVSGSIMGNAAVGDFVGDRRSDIFYADGKNWFVSDAGASQFIVLNASIARVGSLRFGDFDGDGKADVFSVVNGNWAVSYSGATRWRPLRPKLSDSVADLILADFNGDGRVDVATSIESNPTGVYVWMVSYSGTGRWTALRGDLVPLSSAAAVGRFDGNASADFLLWHDNYLDIVASGAGTAVRRSREDMR
jgi:hypothetical protein